MTSSSRRRRRRRRRSLSSSLTVPDDDDDDARLMKTSLPRQCVLKAADVSRTSLSGVLADARRTSDASLVVRCHRRAAGSCALRPRRPWRTLSTTASAGRRQARCERRTALEGAISEMQSRRSPVASVERRSI